MDLISIVLIIAGLGVGTGAGYIVRQRMGTQKAGTAEAQAEKLVKEAKEQEQKILLEAREKSLKLAEEVKQDEQKQRQELTDLEKRVAQKEEQLASKLEGIDEERKRINDRERELTNLTEKNKQQLAEQIKKIDEIKNQQLERLEKISSLTKERAEELVLELTEQRAKDRVLKTIEKYEEHIENEKERLAKRIITMTISRLASEVTTEHSTSTVQLPNDEMKGRIIGREGRNIKTLEKLTGVDLLVDETPNAIVISGFNAIRRYVAKLAIERLLTDGRIHPGHIEGAVAKAKKDVEKKIKEAGEAALREVGIRNYHPKLAEVAGRLLFRTSYGQNQLKHAVEVSTIAGLMATELKADIQVSKAAGFLHDIGKAIDHEVEGTHSEIGEKLMRKFGFPDAVINAAETHHTDAEQTTPEAWIVAAADAISAARPGARHNATEEYIKRVTELEAIAKAFEGVESVFAIEAGREIRVMVLPEMIDDLQAKKLAHAISDKIEHELSYPGEIKVNVIRETRAIDYAR